MTAERGADSADAVAPGVTRRGLLWGGGIGLGLGAVGGALAAASARPRTSPDPAASPTPQGRVVARGIHQAGIARPATPQKNTVVVVADVPSPIGASEVRGALEALGSAVDRLTDGADAAVLPDGPGDLTITVGVGPRWVSMLDPQLPGASGLPVFASDGPLNPGLSGGDLLLSVCGSDAGVLHAVAAALLDAVPAAVRRWSQTGVRGAGEGTIVRNPLGYHDGIVVPRTDAELDANVWITDGPAAGGTIAVVRRLRLDVARFRGESAERQDAIVGRRRADGVPLSGGGPTDAVDLRAKTPEGDYLVPARSHARAAHPSFTDSALMLRRGYAYSNATAGGTDADDGLLFVCFQRELETFVRTQHRLDEVDDLMTYATVTASASFLVLPGRTTDGTWGSAL